MFYINGYDINTKRISVLDTSDGVAELWSSFDLRRALRGKNIKVYGLCGSNVTLVGAYPIEVDAEEVYCMFDILNPLTSWVDKAKSVDLDEYSEFFRVSVNLSGKNAKVEFYYTCSDNTQVSLNDLVDSKLYAQVIDFVLALRYKK